MTETKRRSEAAGEAPARERILDAALAAFTEAGFADASTLEIATRARVSKRELYALVGNKKDMLIACIAARARQFKVPGDLPVPRDRVALDRTLNAFGEQLLREISDPTVMDLFRLAIGEAVRVPEIARTLDSVGRAASRDALIETMTNARAHGLVHGDPAEMAEQFGALLWGSLMVGLLLGVAERPSPREMARRARNATAAFLKLHPQPGKPARS